MEEEKTQAAIWSVPVVLLVLYCFSCGIAFRPTINFVFFHNAQYIGTAAQLAFELGVLGAMLLFRLARFERAATLVTPSLVFIWLLVAWSGITLFWSWTEKPMESAGYWLQLIAQIVIIVEGCAFVPHGRGPELAKRAFLWGLMLLAVQSIIFGSLNILSELEQEWYKNTYAHAAALMFLIAASEWANEGWRISRRVMVPLLAILLAGAVFALYTSKTVVGAVAVAGAILYILGGGGGNKIFAGVILVVGLGLALADPVMETWEKYQRDVAYASTLSERTVLWEYVRRFIYDHPGFGLGFDGFRSAVPGIFNVGVAHAHNDLLMVWVNLGLPGLVIAIAWYGSYLMEALRTRGAGEVGKQAAVLPLALMAYTLIRGLVEADRFLTVLPVDIAVITMIGMAHARQSNQSL